MLFLIKWFRRVFESSAVEAKNGAININGKTYAGKNVSVVNGRVLIDGKEVTSQASPRIEIVVRGTLETLKVDCCDKLTVEGAIGSLHNGSGDVICWDVTGNVSSVSGDVSCANVKGNISSVSGDIFQR